MRGKEVCCIGGEADQNTAHDLLSDERNECPSRAQAQTWQYKGGEAVARGPGLGEVPGADYSMQAPLKRRAFQHGGTSATT